MPDQAIPIFQNQLQQTPNIARMVAANDDKNLTDAQWRRLIAIGIVAGDISASGIARYGGVHPTQAEAALKRALQSDLMNVDGSIDDITKLQLVANLPTDDVARINASVARHLFAAGPEKLVEAVSHARAAGSLVEPDEMVAMADHGGKMSLLLGDYASANELLGLAVELDTSKDLVTQGHRLCDLALAADGLGNVPQARQYLARAVSLGELANDAHLIARGAVQHALPTDWYAGDPRAARLLQRASEADLDDDDEVAVHAARAFVEMRIPLTVEEGQQFAWVTRPAVAQSLADEALQLSNNRSTEVRTLALLAWRATHRAPRFLNQRREVSAEALDLAQNLRHPSHQVNAAVAMNVDALESGDRPLSDQALAVARWVAERDGNPRLKWQAFCLAAGLAHLDGDTESAERFRVLAKTVGEKAQLPGWMGAEFLFQGELVISHDEVEPLSQYLFDETFPGLANPIGRSCIAYCFARTGDTATAERYIRRAMRQLDDESSYLLLTTRMTATALLVGAPDLLRDLGEVLTPWVDHIAVDSNGWWCDGPVSGWLAEIHHALGHSEQAQILAEQARVVARALNDQRTMQRLDRLTQKFRVSITTQPTGGLSERELRVLTMLATGSTNAEIARQLSYSVSTIRDDTTSIYRKLQVKGRAEAVGRATQLGFIADPR